MLLDSPQGLLAAASHDLRQPVQALGLLAATLEERTRRSDERGLARDIAELVQGLDRSIAALLELSRLDAGELDCRPQALALGDLFLGLHRRFAREAECRGLALRWRPGGRSVRADPVLLDRVLGNLVHNALKYTSQGGVVVVARSRPGRVQVEVWDTGPGIPAEAFAQVFQPFFRLARDQRSRTQGSGLGLAIVRRLCDRMGLGLELASRPGRGSVFRIGIPVAAA